MSSFWKCPWLVPRYHCHLLFAATLPCIFIFHQYCFYYWLLSLPLLQTKILSSDMEKVALHTAALLTLTTTHSTCWYHSHFKDERTYAQKGLNHKVSELGLKCRYLETLFLYITTILHNTLHINYLCIRLSPGGVWALWRQMLCLLWCIVGDHQMLPIKRKKAGRDSDGKNAKWCALGELLFHTNAYQPFS